VSIRRAQISVKSSGPLRIRIPDPNDFRKLTGTSLSNVTYVIKFSWRSGQFLEMWSKMWKKCPISQCWKILKNSWIRIDM